MNAEKCLHILREIKDTAFATVDENGLPQIRIIDIMLAEKETVYFCTARGKDFYQQLLRNDSVAVTGLNKDVQMVRLHGQVRKLTAQKKWIDRIFEDNPSMNTVYPGESRYILEAFCIDNGTIEFFDLGHTPIVRKWFTLGTTTASSKGFVISDACIECGTCERCCPQQCIVDFSIDQEHCLHCGLCLEKCPVGAIQRKGV